MKNKTMFELNKEYTVCGQKMIVGSHFVGNKNLDEKLFKQKVIYVIKSSQLRSRNVLRFFCDNECSSALLFIENKRKILIEHTN